MPELRERKPVAVRPIADDPFGDWTVGKLYDITYSDRDYCGNACFTDDVGCPRYVFEVERTCTPRAELEVIYG